MSTSLVTMHGLPASECVKLCDRCGLAEEAKELWLNYCGCPVFLHRQCLALAQFEAGTACKKCPVCSAAWRNPVHLTFVNQSEHVDKLVNDQRDQSGMEVLPTRVSWAERAAAAEYLQQNLSTIITAVSYFRPMAAVSDLGPLVTALEFWLDLPSPGIRYLLHSLRKFTEAYMAAKHAHTELERFSDNEAQYIADLAKKRSDLEDRRAQQRRQSLEQLLSSQAKHISRGGHNIPRHRRRPNRTSAPPLHLTTMRFLKRTQSCPHDEHTQRFDRSSVRDRIEYQFTGQDAVVCYYVDLLKELLPVFNGILDKALKGL